MNKLNTEINGDLESKELLLNSDFLRLLKDFLNFSFEQNYFEYINSDIDLNTLVIKLRSSDLKKEVPFTDEEILISLGKLFSDKLLLGFFTDYTEKYNITYETAYMFSLVGDYLLSINEGQENCANKSTYISSRLKENIGDILSGRKLENTILILNEIGFELISENREIIEYIDLEDKIDLYGNNDDNFVYLKVISNKGNIFYMNKAGKHLITTEKQIIEGNNYFYYQEVVLDGLDGKQNIVFDKDFNRITLFDLFSFLNEGKSSTIKMMGKVLDRFKNVYLSSIGEFYEYNGIKFIKYSISGLTLKKFILRDNGDILNDDSDIDIEELYGITSIAGLEFIQYGLFDKDYKDKEIDIELYPIDGLLDKDGEIIYVYDKPLIKVQEMDYKGLKYFIINDDPNFLLTKYELLKELKYFKPFNIVDNSIIGDDYIVDDEEIDFEGKTFSFIFDEEIKVYFDGVEIEKIIGRIDENGKLLTYIKIGGIISDIDNDKLENQLSKSKDSEIILKEYKNQIERISNI